MTYWDIVILSVVEGVTEFLPISSTGHLIIVGKLLGLPASAFVSSFNIAIQFGAISAVLILYGRRLVAAPALGAKVLMAFLPTAVIGFAAYSLVKNLLLHSLMVMAAALFFGGGLMIVFERWYGRRPRPARVLDQLTYQQAFWLGLCQAASIIPGVSRAASTILGGLWLGLSRSAIVEFSFLLAIPTMLAATGYDLYRSAGAFAAADWFRLSLGFILSLIAALVAVKWLLNFIRRHDFTVFGVYRMFLAGLIWWLLLF